MLFFKFRNLTAIVLAVIFALFFYDKLIGINILMYELVVVLISYYIHKPKFRSKLSKLILVGTLVSLIMVVLHNSIISKTVNILSFILLISVITFSEYQLIKHYFFQFFQNIIEGVSCFINSIFSRKVGGISFIYYVKIILVPILIILVFLFIYYNSNTYFAKLSDSFFNNIFNWIPSINIVFVFYLFIGILLSVSAIYGIKNNIFIEKENKLTEVLKRKRKLIYTRSIIGLKNEYKSGVFLLVILNFMLLIFNYSDITKVWFSYRWAGGFLKNFVHSGTYLLIVSLLLSIGIVLYYFKGNLNFYSKNKPLKILTYIWLAQNLILIISLVIRNSIYIDYFALAYKRIGVFVFLLIVCFGIYTIMNKVFYKKSFYYLVKMNTYFIYMIFICLTLINWDVFIAKYNVKSYKKSFIEMEYLLQLSDKALPYINIRDEKLADMEIIQTQKFSFKRNYITHYTYKRHLENKLLRFINSYPNRSIMEWNYADYKAYIILKK